MLRSTITRYTPGWESPLRMRSARFSAPSGDSLTASTRFIARPMRCSPPSSLGSMSVRAHQPTRRKPPELVSEIPCRAVRPIGRYVDDP